MEGEGVDDDDVDEEEKEDDDVDDNDDEVMEGLLLKLSFLRDDERTCLRC